MDYDVSDSVGLHGHDRTSSHTLRYVLVEVLCDVVDSSVVTPRELCWQIIGANRVLQWATIYSVSMRRG
jgi:hypothetical protein